MPSLLNSPWIRGAPHSGFAAPIWSTTSEWPSRFSSATARCPPQITEQDQKRGRHERSWGAFDQRINQSLTIRILANDGLRLVALRLMVASAGCGASSPAPVPSTVVVPNPVPVQLPMLRPAPSNDYCDRPD